MTRHQKNALAGGFVLACLAGAVWLAYYLRPVVSGTEVTQRKFEITSGQGFREIVHGLKAAGLIRSEAAFQVYAVLTQLSRHLQPGSYALSPADSAAGIATHLAAGPEVDVAVTIPEGLTAVEIDPLLAQAGVTRPGAFLALVKAQSVPVEGRLFPDTYRFYFDSSPQKVLDKFIENFNRKAAPLLAADPKNSERNLIIASMLEKEVPGPEDRRIVAGLLLKRFAAGMPLQVDATVCYLKLEQEPGAKCYPLTAADKKIESSYNTYLHSGWPPGPISNPGLEAIRAALDPMSSPYWYYLSDPETGKTIFAVTLEEHAANRAKYLGS